MTIVVDAGFEPGIFCDIWEAELEQPGATFLVNQTEE